MITELRKFSIASMHNLIQSEKEGVAEMIFSNVYSLGNSLEYALKKINKQSEFRPECETPIFHIVLILVDDDMCSTENGIAQCRELIETELQWIDNIYVVIKAKVFAHTEFHIFVNRVGVKKKSIARDSFAHIKLLGFSRKWIMTGVRR